MSLFTRVYGKMNALFGRNNSQVSSMLNNQNMIANLQNPTNLPVGSYLSGDKNFAKNQAMNGFEAQAYDAMLESTQPKDKDFESFAYFT